MERIKNHKGKNSALILRPADVHETSVAWKMALENTDTPTGLILSRQNIKDIPSAGNRYKDALQAQKGAYIVKKSDGKPDIILVANGSEVATLFEGAALLEERKKIRIQIVSVPSEGLFRTQSKEYQEGVLPSGIPVFGLTAGVPFTLCDLVGANGRVWGLDHFAYSAPFDVLDEKLGFTGENIYGEVCDFLGI
jgi:transketolase